MVSGMSNRSNDGGRWHEVLAPDGTPRPLYAPVLRNLAALTPSRLRGLEDQMDATLREMGVTFHTARSDPWGRQPWSCDLLPQIIDADTWNLIGRALRQRLRAWEALLADIYHRREILRAGIIPVQAVLGSPNYQTAASGLPPPHNAYLHFSGICVARNTRGTLQIKQHQFAHPTGISYMMQNRRAMARVVPDLFEEFPVQSVAETPVLILEHLRRCAQHFEGEQRVVLLSAGEDSAVTSEQSFLARRMGIPMVQGGDLLVLDDQVYLKTVRGLEQVHVIYNCIPDAWLDPLVFQRGAVQGVPGIVHCLRKGTVALVNAVGSQLADDRTLLAFAAAIIRFYLGETPVLPAVPTLWLGDIDQCETALENLDEWRIRPIYREWGSDLDSVTEHDAETLRKHVREQPARFIAQPRDEGATTLCFEEGRARHYPADHIVFAIRSGQTFEVLPGALTRVHSRPNAPAEFGRGWTSKDTWVLADLASAERAVSLPVTRAEVTSATPRPVTSRVAESFYWMGRYLERARHQAYLISVVETLETEELNSAERKHYRPMWNRLLPPLEKSAGTSRRSIVNRLDRYRLVLLPEPGSVLRTFLRAMANAEAVQDSISPEAWATLNAIRICFEKVRFQKRIAEPAAVRATRRVSTAVTELIPQFFGVAADTMLEDDGWRFCEIGKLLERAIITANSVVSIRSAFAETDTDKAPHVRDIELSAFLRLLGTRDAYRRIFQMRAEPIPLLELLWQHPQVPRSVFYCLTQCEDLLRRSIALELDPSRQALATIGEFITKIRRIDWTHFVTGTSDDDEPLDVARAQHAPASAQLDTTLHELLHGVLELHAVIADSFLNHQAHIAHISPSARNAA